jgi:hypothetical protein
MPAPRRTISPEEMDAYRAACAEAETLGAIQRHRIGELPPDSRIELFCHSVASGCVDPDTFQPTTPAEWIASCKARGVVPVVPNR